ncbi:Bifunctional purple acid phosphatase 26 [Citrus sinensis]|uniref:Bifunctional purple acid phosphatase 26 n=1 Tax=Citrus sinensis TaxID=2711 RepID=A0ACB8NMF0_CITSI|nr:Bifunctional purple acid phosphatase 26 [Citrus sinensis]
MAVSFAKLVPLFQIMLYLTLLLSLNNGTARITSRFIRTEWPSADIPLHNKVFDIPKGHNAPQQVRITQGDYDGKAVIISWVTPNELGSNRVQYGKLEKKYDSSAEGTVTNYTFYKYKSGYIHHCLVDDLEYDTKYYYKIGDGDSSREFWFQTPPKIHPDAPYTFGIIGDLGQTYNSLSTLKHYMQSGGQSVLFLGDLSYADRYEYNDVGIRWDSWGRFIEQSAAYQPWIWSAGNHEIEFMPNMGEVIPFKSYLHRIATPYTASKSTNPLCSNVVHYMEGESMRAVFESWFVHSRVDFIFAGHVHAYERSYRISNIHYNFTSGDRYPVPDKSAPVYLTVGDGGNQEGLAGRFLDPQPNYSAFREASYGHSTLEIKNRTHAFYHWNRNDDGNKVTTDSVVFHNQYWSNNLRRRKLKKNHLKPRVEVR